MTERTLAVRVPTMATNALEDPERLGNLLAASGYFSDTRDAAQAVVKVLAGAELGFGPIASMTGINIIKGRVTMSAFLMAATVKRHPKYNYRVREHSDQRAVIEFLEGGKVVGESEFTAAMAKTARLTGENWQKYPANMLFWRAMSNGAKFFCPDAFAGAPVYTPDELGADVDDAGDLVDTPASYEAEQHERAAVAAATPAPDPDASRARAQVEHGDSPAPSQAPHEPTLAERHADNDVAIRRQIGHTQPVPAATGAAAPATDAGANGTDGASSAPVPAAGAPLSGAPSAPTSDVVTAEDVEAFQSMVQRHGVPENVWRVALLAADVDRLEDLPREAFDALVRRASARAAEGAK